MINFDELSPALKQKAVDIATALNKKNDKIYKIDPLTIIMIVQAIIKLIQWFIEWRKNRAKDLNFFQKMVLWAATARYVKFGSVVDVLNTSLEHLDDEFIKECKYNQTYIKGLNPDEVK